MSDLREIVKIINQIAIDNSESNSKEGEVVKLNDDGSHNIKLTEENGVEYIIQNRWPDDGKSKYPEGTRVIMTLPDGSLDRSVIRGNANFTLPSSPTVKHFSTAPIVPPVPVTGTIYLACPTENKIKQYSLSGTAGTDIVTNNDSQYNIVTDGTYLYYGSSAAYAVYKIKPDGSGFQEIVLQSRYYIARGLAINATSTHLYTAYSIYGENQGIAKINISTGEIEETEITDISFNEVADLCGDTNYLYILGRNICGASRIAVYDFNLNFIREISTDGIYNKIAADGTNLYLYNSYSSGEGTFVKIYSTDGTLLTSISCYNAKAVAAKEGKFYVVDGGNKKIKKYSFSDVLEKEFDFEGTVEDAVII